METGTDLGRGRGMTVRLVGDRWDLGEWRVMQYFEFIGNTTSEDWHIFEVELASY
jgi:hypothetical protein